MIWRQLEVPDSITIAGLHEVLQVAFGWSGEHLHRFTVHGKEYGICYEGGMVFDDDPYQVGTVNLAPEMINSDLATAASGGISLA